MKSGNYRPVFQIFYWIFIFNFIFLGWLGGQVADGIYLTLSRLTTMYYFGYIFVVLPLLGKFEKTKQLPESIDDSCVTSKAE